MTYICSFSLTLVVQYHCRCGRKASAADLERRLIRNKGIVPVVTFGN